MQPTGINLGYITPYSTGIINVINGILVPVLIAIAFIVFLWGIYKTYIYAPDSDTERAKGHQFVLWGVIGFVIILSLWGIVNLVMGTFNLSVGKAPPFPTIGGSTGSSNNQVFPSAGSQRGLQPVGASCSGASDCGSGFCNGNVCRSSATASGGKSNGTSCSLPNECVSGICTNGSCTPPPTSLGQANGTSCFASYDCASGSCVDGTCGPPAAGTGQAGGTSCFANYDCASGSCDQTTSRCVESSASTPSGDTYATPAQAACLNSSCQNCSESGACLDQADTGTTDPYQAPENPDAEPI